MAVQAEKSEPIPVETNDDTTDFPKTEGNILLRKAREESAALKSWRKWTEWPLTIAAVIFGGLFAAGAGAPGESQTV